MVESHQSLFRRKGGPLAVTDANLLLGRLIPSYFPKIFGPTEKEPLDYEASKTKFLELQKEINSHSQSDISLDEIVYGFETTLCLASCPDDQS